MWPLSGLNADLTISIEHAFDELAKATGVRITEGGSVAKGLHDGVGGHDPLHGHGRA